MTNDPINGINVAGNHNPHRDGAFRKAGCEMSTRGPKLLPNVAAGDADRRVAKSLLWTDFRRKRRGEIVSAVNHGIGFANEALSASHGRPPRT